jgi:hypothetical protein
MILNNNSEGAKVIMAHVKYLPDVNLEVIKKSTKMQNTLSQF